MEVDSARRFDRRRKRAIFTATGRALEMGASVASTKLAKAEQRDVEAYVEHGDYTADPDPGYSIVGQRNFVESFAKTLDLDHFILAGNSMGGHVSAAFAMENAEMVDCLILIRSCTTRQRCPVLSSAT